MFYHVFVSASQMSWFSFQPVMSIKTEQLWCLGHFDEHFSFHLV